MKRFFFLVVLLSLSMIMISCSKDNTNGNSSSGDGDADGDSDGDSDGDGDGDGDGDSDAPPIDPGSNLDKIALIDDLEDGDPWIRTRGKRYGHWFTYHDDSKGGSQIPNGDFEATKDGMSNSNYRAYSKGSGFKQWGAGIGFDLSNPGDTTCEDAPPKGRHPYDASKFDGITFFAKGNHKLRIAIPTPTTLPTEEGGECTKNCFDDFGRDILLTKEWTRYAFKFENLKQEGWGAKTKFDPTKIISIMFQVSENVDFDFSIDDVAFFGNEDEDKVINGGKGTDVGIDDLKLAAGFRSSAYGIDPFPSREYWSSVGTDMAAKFKDATPSAVWIVGEIVTNSEKPKDNGKIKLNFPRSVGDYSDIEFDDCDLNEKTLTLFDELGYKVWLQVEPGFVDVTLLADLVLRRYKHHPCVIGFGVDIEWFRTKDGKNAEAMSDEDAQDWRSAVRKYNPKYSLLLKHWEESMMPPNERDGLFFLDDAQEMGSLSALDAKFKVWADNFSPAPVGFQVGYDEDKSWWGGMSDPPKEIGDYLIDSNANMKGFFWVDFTLQTVFPPK